MSEISDHYKYEMSSSPCGLCFIINIKDVKNKPSRTGTDIDAEKLKNTFEKFDFTVYVTRDNLTSSEIKEFLKVTARTDHSKYSAFVCCILSHGKEKVIFGSDGEEVDIQKDVINQFFSSNCPTLVGKPKLFFIQACQGDTDMEYVSLNSAEHSEVDGPSSNSYSNSLPEESDYLLACATVPGFTAARDPDLGSWFIGALTDQLQATGHEEDILNVLRKVNRKVSEKIAESDSNPRFKQIPFPSFTLTKKVIFRLKTMKDTREN